MELKQLQRNFEAFAKADPLYAILCLPEKQGNRWELAEFFKTGEEEIDGVLRRVASLQFPLRQKTALDFGCGVGRLTQALARHFDECHGIDIAPSMIKLARKHNCHGTRCHYAVNEVSHLRRFADNRFDFIYSNIVLQHMRPQYSRNYIKEFLRILAPGGLLAFQLPSARAPIARAPIVPLPDAAFKAQIRVCQPTLRAKRDTAMVLKVRVKNVSNTPWQSVVLGNHWLSDRGQMLVQDDGRAHLPLRFQPQAEVELDLNVTIPAQPGDYVLELDLVQEAVAWFKDKGSPATHVPCHVERAPQSLFGLYRKLVSRLTRNFTPVVEMYSIPKVEVLALLQGAGGKVVAVEENLWCGHEWESYDYFVAKDE